MEIGNVFGPAITEGATRKERAINALNNRNAVNKRDIALDYVRRLKKNWGNGVSTLGIFYNATGETMIFTQEDSWYGEIVGPYPIRVQNGQWGAFFHGKWPGAASGSVGLVVYRVRMSDTQFCNQLIAWQTPWRQGKYNNQAYGDVFDDGKVDPPSKVYNNMNNFDRRQHITFKMGMMVSSVIEQGTSPVYEAEFTRQDAAESSVMKFADQQHIIEALSTVVDPQDDVEGVDQQDVVEGLSNVDKQEVEASSTEDKQDVVEASPTI